MTRAEIVHWVAESLQPFKIVKERGFQCLMKTGWPGYYIPSGMTVSWDVRLTFGRTWEWITQMLQVPWQQWKKKDGLLTHLQDYSGSISFVTNAWTSPNHYAYVALTTHFENQGQPITIVLDIVEVAKVSELLSWHSWDWPELRWVAHRHPSCQSICRIAWAILHWWEDIVGNLRQCIKQW